MYIDWENQAQDHYVIDIETDDLNATLIWVMCWKNARTGETGECIGHDEIRQFFIRSKGSIYIGHNILGFDGRVLNQFIGTRLSVANCIDTLILSTLFHPARAEGHSLDSWGEVFGKPKIYFKDFGRLSQEMITYCHRDVEITCELFRRLIKTLRGIGFSDKSIHIQHHFTAILNRQRRNGFYFNGPEALSLYSHLRARERAVEAEVRQVFPPERKYVATRSMYKKDGSLTKIYETDRDRYIIQPANEEGMYLAFEDVEFNLGSYNQRTERLLALGWKNLPDEVTKTGNPKPFDKGDLVPSLKEFLEESPMPEVELIARWMSINGRANMVNTWLENWNENTGCIHGKLFVADTLRLRHQSPNTANIPAVRQSKDGSVLFGEEGYYTYEARDLWTARSGRVLVGTDAAGLELRMLAHYLNRPAFTDQVINGDPHQFNADTVGIDRPLAKTLLYAIQYGAQDKKVAATLKVSRQEGGKIRSEFLERLGLDEVMDNAQHEQEAGRIALIDGSQIICNSPHKALNYKLQGGGARVMAQAAIILEGYIRKDGLDSMKVGDIHDEWQYDTDPKDSKQHAIRSVQAIREAGEELNMNLPLDGTAKEGLTWAQTH